MLSNDILKFLSQNGFEVILKKDATIIWRKFSIILFSIFLIGFGFSTFMSVGLIIILSSFSFSIIAVIILMGLGSLILLFNLIDYWYFKITLKNNQIVVRDLINNNSIYNKTDMHGFELVVAKKKFVRSNKRIKEVKNFKLFLVLKNGKKKEILYFRSIDEQEEKVLKQFPHFLKEIYIIK